MSATTEILSLLIGLYMVCSGFALLNDRKVLTQMAAALESQPILAYISGIMAFAIGGAILAVHSSWDGFAAVLVSLFGWIALIKGALIMGARKWFVEVSGKMDFAGRSGLVMAVIQFVFGGLLIASALF